MGVSFVHFLLGIKECSAVNITSAFHIHGNHVNCVKYYKSHLELLVWLGRNVINGRNLVRGEVLGMDFYPELDYSLRNRG